MLFYISNNSSTVTVTIAQISGTYSWYWDKADSAVRFYSTSFYHTKTITGDALIGFDCPKDVNSGSEGVLPWGLMAITIKVGGATVATDTIDFRDENWSSGYASHDIDVYYDSKAMRGSSRCPW